MRWVRKILHWMLFSCVLLTGIVVLLHSQGQAPGSDYTKGQVSPSSFAEYLEATHAWLIDHKDFVSDQRDQELAANMPYELIPENPNGEGVILVHGLSDSPYSFIDIAKRLQQQGYQVRVLLLPGHGSKPSDLHRVQAHEWSEYVAHQVGLFKPQVERLWLGGYSTGGNLVTTYAIDDPVIAGLLLFAPGFEGSSFAIKITPLARLFTDWASKGVEDNYTRYNSLSMHGVSLYYQTTREVQHALNTKGFDRPVFLALTETDATIDSKFALQQYQQNFSDPNSLLHWYGEKQFVSEAGQAKIESYSMDLADLHISNGSHLSLLFAPENGFYGTEGTYRVCVDVLDTKAYQRCLNDPQPWYGYLGYKDKQHPERIYARLSWNPYFETMMDGLVELMNTQ